SSGTAKHNSPQLKERILWESLYRQEFYKTARDYLHTRIQRFLHDAEAIQMISLNRPTKSPGYSTGVRRDGPSGLGNLAVSLPSCFLLVAWPLGTKRVLQLNDYYYYSAVSERKRLTEGNTIARFQQSGCESASACECEKYNGLKHFIGRTLPELGPMLTHAVWLWYEAATCCILRRRCLTLINADSS
ncbi:hypothetical protein T265_12563, partial [Opisthorchis viverrini]